MNSKWKSISHSHISPSFLLIGIETMIRSSLENHTRPDSRPKRAKSIPAKTLPFRAAQTYMACIREKERELRKITKRHSSTMQQWLQG